jgi:TPP-dependent pyruvate/acetoin dehydrogenase alpha subunit
VKDKMNPRLDDQQLVDCCRLMWKMRLHEEAIKVLYTQGKVGGTTHLYIGQEAVAAGIITQLRPDAFLSKYQNQDHW